MIKAECVKLHMAVKIDKQSRDLGIQYTAGLTKTNIKARGNRFLKTKKRRDKIIKLAKISRLARRLFSGSADAAATWDTRLTHSTTMGWETWKRKPSKQQV